MARRSRRQPPGPPLGRYLDRRTRTRGLVGSIIALLIALVALLDHGGVLRSAAGTGDDQARYDGKTFRVVHVVDGDTLDVDAPDGDRPKTRIRFWGIDCPEMDHPNLPGADGAKPRQPFALEATELTRLRAEGKSVRLSLERQRIRDRYGRLLAYIELPDGKMLNEELLAAGLAKADGRWSHRWIDRYKLIEKQAKHDRLGLWGGQGKATIQPATVGEIDDP